VCFVTALLVAGCRHKRTIVASDDDLKVRIRLIGESIRSLVHCRQMRSSTGEILPEQRELECILLGALNPNRLPMQRTQPYPKQARGSMLMQTQLQSKRVQPWLIPILSTIVGVDGERALRLQLLVCVSDLINQGELAHGQRHQGEHPTATATVAVAVAG